jgi:hypothetical protein
MSSSHFDLRSALMWILYKFLLFLNNFYDYFYIR